MYYWRSQLAELSPLLTAMLQRIPLVSSYSLSLCLRLVMARVWALWLAPELVLATVWRQFARMVPATLEVKTQLAR